MWGISQKNLHLNHFHFSKSFDIISRHTIWPPTVNCSKHICIVFWRMGLGTLFFSVLHQWLPPIAELRTYLPLSSIFLNPYQVNISRAILMSLFWRSVVHDQIKQRLVGKGQIVFEYLSTFTLWGKHELLGCYLRWIAVFFPLPMRIQHKTYFICQSVDHALNTLIF